MKIMVDSEPSCSTQPKIDDRGSSLHVKFREIFSSFSGGHRPSRALDWHCMNSPEFPNRGGPGQEVLKTDLLVRGLRDGVAGVLADVTVVHPVTGRGLPSLAASSHRRAAAADSAERKKQGKNLDHSTTVGFGFSALAFETYGAPGVDFLAFLKEVAERAATSPQRARDALVFRLTLLTLR